MAKKLFVGNLEWGVTDEDLNELFSQHGTVEEAIVIKNQGRSKGFGFVTFAEDAEAEAAVEALNGYMLNDREMVVNEARPPKPRNDRFDDNRFEN